MDVGIFIFSSIIEDSFPLSVNESHDRHWALIEGVLEYLWNSFLLFEGSFGWQTQLWPLLACHRSYRNSCQKRINIERIPKVDKLTSCTITIQIWFTCTTLKVNISLILQKCNIYPLQSNIRLWIQICKGEISFVNPNTKAISQSHMKPHGLTRVKNAQLQKLILGRFKMHFPSFEMLQHQNF